MNAPFYGTLLEELPVHGLIYNASGLVLVRGGCAAKASKLIRLIMGSGRKDYRELTNNEGR